MARARHRPRSNDRPSPGDRSIRAISDFVSQKLSTLDRVHSTATHSVLKAYKRDGDAFAEADPDHRLPVTP